MADICMVAASLANSLSSVDPVDSLLTNSLSPRRIPTAPVPKTTPVFHQRGNGYMPH